MSNHKQILEQLQLPTQLFIDNEWVNAIDGSTFEVIDPSTEEVLCRVAHAKSADVDAAVKAARRAFAGWSTLDPVQRQQLMFKLADLLEQQKETVGTQDHT